MSGTTAFFVASPALWRFPSAMVETPPTVALLCLGVMSLCAVAMTAAVLLISRDLHRALRRVNAMAPAADEALREAQRAFRHARRLLARAGRTVQPVEAIVRQACEAAAETLQRFRALRLSTERLLGKWVGNGAGAEPRRHHRRH